MVDETSMLNKVPPHSLEAEQSVLGAMLLDKDAIAKAIDILVVDDFYREAHRIIFDAVVTLYNRAEPVDLIMVTELLRQKNAFVYKQPRQYGSNCSKCRVLCQHCQGQIDISGFGQCGKSDIQYGL